MNSDDAPFNDDDLPAPLPDQDRRTTFNPPALLNDMNLTGIPKSHAEAVKSVAELGTEVIKAAQQLAGFIGKIIGTTAEDMFQACIGQPMRLRRARIAAEVDEKIAEIHSRRKVTETQPVSPSLAMPLLEGAYNESRKEVQDLWASLIAAAMDPLRADRVRLAFADTIRRFDPLDAVVLQNIALFSKPGPCTPSLLASHLQRSVDEVEVSIENLIRLGCVNRLQINSNCVSTPYSRELLRACSD